MSDSEKIGPLMIYQKEKWGPGPWQTEPDRMDWIRSGFSCFALRNEFGNWCGYVGVPKEHPDYGKSHTDMSIDPINVHGGLTYTDKCQGHICHVPKAGMPADVWWFGFDTGHAGDLSPRVTAALGDHSDLLEWQVYRDADYIKKETNSLARQLKKRFVLER